ncbi:MAG: cupin domain-containing protein [Chloroflexota bacterium]
MPGRKDRAIARTGCYRPCFTPVGSTGADRHHPAGSHVPAHYHQTSVEVCHVLRGECDIEVNGEHHTLRPGDIMLMEPGDVHALTGTGEELFELLVFKTNAADGDTLWDKPDLLESANTAYATLKEDAEAWRQLQEDRTEWDDTLADGLEDV